MMYYGSWGGDGYMTLWADDVSVYLNDDRSSTELAVARYLDSLTMPEVDIYTKQYVKGSVISLKLEEARRARKELHEGKTRSYNLTVTLSANSKHDFAS